MKKMLIVYYTWSNGNTKNIAERLQAATGADIAVIDTKIPYPEDYQTTVDQGQDEVQRGFRPEIKELNADIKDYDVIAIGSPTWWYTMAPAVSTFVESQNFDGKTVIPFSTHGGWPGHLIKDIKKICKGAEVVCPMEIKFDSQGGPNLETSEKEIDNWINEVKKVL